MATVETTYRHRAECGAVTHPRSTGGDPSSPLRIAGNGRLGPQKDARFFAEAVSSARSDGIDVDAVWIGGGDDEIARHLLDSGVDVTGWCSREQALKILATCDVYFHTAQWEGFPISILEATTAGLPVIARAQPYIRGFEMPMTVAQPSELGDVLTLSLIHI